MIGRSAKRPGALPVEGRLDWLALLPFDGIATVVVLIGEATDDELRRMARHFGVASVERRLPAGDVDVLIVRDLRCARRALGALAPAGVAWLEGTSRRSRFTRVAARAARANGRQVRATYWVLPRARSARRYVPTTNRAALRWYLDELFVSRTTVERIGRRATMLWPGVATLVLGDRATVVVGPLVRSGLLATGAGDGLPPDQVVIMQSGGHDLGNRTIVIPFGAEGGQTGSILKVASAPEMNDLVEAEFIALQALQSGLPDSIAASIPLPDSRWIWANRTVTRESMFPGPTVDHAIRSAGIDPGRALDEVGDWLGRFHLATAHEDTWSVDRFDRVVRPTLEAYESAYGSDASVQQLFRGVEARAQELAGLRLVEVRRHWDFTPSNVILSEGGIAVIDWEPGIGRPMDGRGLPLCDLDYFVKFWLHAVVRPSSVAEENALFPHTSAAEAVCCRAVIESYCASLGIDPRFVPMISVYQWAEQAVHDQARGRRLGGLPETRCAATRHVIALALDQDALFAER